MQPAEFPRAAPSGLRLRDLSQPARSGTESLPAPEKPCGRVNALVSLTRKRSGWSQKPVFRRAFGCNGWLVWEASRICCEREREVNTYILDNIVRKAQSMNVEGLRSGTKTLPWHKHPLHLDRVTLRVALSSFGLLLQPIANRDYRIEFCIRFPAAAFKHRFIAHQYPVVIHSLVGIADHR
jgi:hypothetical protein